MHALRALPLLLCVGCGRVGYDPLDAADGSIDGDDASSLDAPTDGRDGDSSDGSRDGDTDGSPDGGDVGPDGSIDGGDAGSDAEVGPLPTTLAVAWAKTFSSGMTGCSPSLAADASGQIAVIVEVGGPADFGGGPIGPAQPFIANVGLTSTGDYRYATPFGGTHRADGLDITFGADGNLYATGGFTGTINAGGSDLTVGAAGFLASFEVDGTHRWSRALRGSYVAPTAITTNGASVFVTGFGDGLWDFGEGDIPRTGMNVEALMGGFDIANGATRWVRRVGNVSDDIYGYAAARGPGTTAWLGGWFDESLELDGTYTGSSALSEVFLAQLDEAGTPLEVSIGGGVDVDTVSSAVEDPVSGTYVVGSFVTRASFDGHDVVGTGLRSAFIVKYDGSGVAQWATAIPDGVDLVDVAATREVVIVAGTLREGTMFAGETFTATGGTGEQDVIVVMLSKDEGAVLDALQIGADARDVPFKLAAMPDGSVVLAMAFSGTLDPAIATAFGPAGDLLLVGITPE